MNLNDQLGRKRGLLIYIQIFENRTIAENDINLSDKESFFDYYEVILLVGA